MTLQLLACLAPVQLLACLAPVQLLAACKLPATCEIQSRVPISLHNLEHFFTLFHTLPSHDSHLNIGLLIAKIQANLTRNKANKMVDTIQPYKSYWIRFGVRLGCYVINFTICILCYQPYFLCQMSLLSLQQSVTKLVLILLHISYMRYSILFSILL